MSILGKSLIAGALVAAAGGAAVVSRSGDYCHSPIAAAHAAEEKKATLEIKGMTCASCAIAVKTALKKVDGFKSVEVAVQEGRAVVTYDPTRTDPEALVAAVTKLGYQSRPLPETSAE